MLSLRIAWFRLFRVRSPLLAESLDCFLFLRVLRWFTSPGSLPAPMDSERDTRCSHLVGSPIRKSPDHRLLASPRGLSQLVASFVACLRQGIPTHALSSLTIKLTHYTQVRLPWLFSFAYAITVYFPHGNGTCICVCPSVFSCQRTWNE